MQVVEGIRIQMSTEKLHAHLARRIDYHKTKAAFYQPSLLGTCPPQQTS